MPRRAIALVLLALAACTPRVAPPLAPRWFEIDSQMLAFLDTIHAGLPDEVALCLNGAVRGGVVKITRFRAVRLYDSTPVRVSHDVCAADEFVGVYHNHPDATYCQLSDQDLETAQAYLHEIDIVSCGGGVFAWRARGGASGIVARAP